MKRPILVIGTLFFAAITSACSSGPSTRIEDNPELFSSLQSWEKEKVAKGEVSEGMSPDAVRLAWGEPSTISSGQLGGIYSQRWIYSQQRPTSSSFGFGMGMGAGYSRGYYPATYMGPSMYFPIETTPVNVAYVLFQKGKVKSWEKEKTN